jgi:hypothetical protein
MVAHGIASDKDALDDGRPTNITEYRNPVQILRLLAERGRVIDGSTEEDD